MSTLNKILKKAYLSLPLTFRECVRFRLSTGYFPNLSAPNTFNEKTLYRKLHWTNPLFSTCADKVDAKAYVSARHSDLCVMENLAEGTEVSFDVLKKVVDEQGSVVLKTNHDSGTPFFLDTQSSYHDLMSACQVVNNRLQSRFGQLQCEGWYSHIAPRFFIENCIETKPGVELSDYKFHVFSQLAGRDPLVILHVDFNRFTNHTRSLFDADLNWLPFSVRYPAVHTHLEKPPNFDRMLEIAKDLASPFSYARVDLYNVEGEIFFGEITFAHGSGREKFTDKGYDLWLGNLWTMDPRQ